MNVNTYREVQLHLTPKWKYSIQGGAGGWLVWLG